MKNIKIIIVVKDGCVETVYANHPSLNTDVEILDYDTQDPEEYEECKKREQEICKKKRYKVVA